MPKIASFRLFLPLVFAFVLIACGQESNDTYTPTTDTIVTTGLITLDASKITVVTPGPKVESDVIEDCEIAFTSLDLPYEIVNDDKLILNGNTFELLRPLATPSTKAGIDPRLFAVWGLPAATPRQVTYSIEVEIQSNQITYRNTCSR